MNKSKQLVITTKEVVERERLLSPEETEQILTRARELAQEYPLTDFYNLCEDAIFELMDKKYPDGLKQIPLDTIDADGEEMIALWVKVKNSGYYYPIIEFNEED